jgi:eukaryotic-like serine/threonine-protein kinase
VTECPELAVLESDVRTPELRAHLEGCAGCRLVIEVLEQRAGVDGATECERFEPLLAARADGSISYAADNLLARHLAGCESCRELAGSLAPLGGAEGDQQALPEVDRGSYALGLEVARGGMGRILAARDLRVGRPVAVKELLGRSRALAARFEREARVTARLQHPGIIPIYEIGKWPDGTPFYSMRMVDGRTLREAIADARTLVARLALLPAVIAATEAIAFAHAQRVIHRDLTPANILVGAYGETVVIDWGLAKDLADAHDDDPVEAGPYRRAHGTGELTNAGAVIGTAAYMPPEQAHGEPVDERADVYALGAILYHLLTGHPPYRSRGTDELLAAVKGGPPPAVAKLAPEAPSDLVSIVAKAMARAPADRYTSAGELAEELKRFQTGRMVEAHAYTTAERMRRFIRRNRAPLAVTALAALLLSGVAAIAVTRIVTSRNLAARTVLTLLEEEGRVELLAGNSVRATAYLHAALERGDASPALRFMLATALRDLTGGDVELLDCGGDVRAMTFSPDGGVLVASCHDLAKAWRLSDLREPIATYGPYPRGFDQAVYSHDGRVLLTWGEDGVARLWDAASGELRRSFSHGRDRITFASFTPDDRRIATSGYDGWARIWDTASGVLVREIEAAESRLFRHLYGLLDHEGRLLTVTIEGVGVGWDIETGARLGEFRHGEGFVLGGELSEDGRRAVTCGMDRLVKVWDTRTGRMIWQLAGADDVVWKCVFDRTGTRVLGADHAGEAHVWDVATGATISSVAHGSPIWNARFSHDGRRFVTVSGVDGVVKVWDAATGGHLASHETLGGRDAAFSPDGQLLVAARGDGRLRIWKGLGGALAAVFAWPADATALATTHDGSWIAIAAADGWVRVHDVVTGHARADVHARAPVAAGARHLAVTADDAVLVIDADPTAAPVRLPIAMPAELALGANGTRLAAMFADRDAEVWDVASRRRLASLSGARRVVLSDDGTRAVGWSEGSRPTVWTLDGAHARIELAIDGRYRPIGFASRGTQLVVEIDPGEPRRTVAIWDVAHPAAPRWTIADVVSSPTLDPDGRFVTTIALDRSVATLNLATGTTRAFLGEHMQDAQIDPRGELIAGIAKQGDAVLVVDAADGRLLSRWAIAHGPPFITEDGFEAPRATARWSPDGASILARSSRLAVWAADRQVPRDVAAIVARHVPLRVAPSGRLAPVRARLRGRLERAGSAVAGARIVLEYRKPPELGSEPTTLSSVTTRRHHLALSSDGDGRFAREGLAPGVYGVTFEVGGLAYRLQLDVGPDTQLVLDLARLPASVSISRTP